MKIIHVLMACLSGLSSIAAADIIEYKTPDTIYFHGVQEGDMLKGEIVFINRDQKPIQLGRVRTSCGCTVANYDTEPIPPGKTSKITYTWNTRGFNQHAKKAITLEFIQGHVGTKLFHLEADIDYYIITNPRYISFRNIHANQDTVVSHEFTIVNHLNHAITIDEVTAEDLPYIEIEYQKKKVEVGETYTGKLLFRPHEEMRQRGMLTVKTQEKIYKPLQINLYTSVENTQNE